MVRYGSVIYTLFIVIIHFDNIRGVMVAGAVCSTSLFFFFFFFF
jgi:hypothetical protein